jgi:esterase
VAMTLALAEPGLVDRLVVVDIAPVAYQRGFLDYFKAMRAIHLAGATSRARVDAALAGEVPDAGVRAFLLQNLARADAGFRWRPNLDALARHMGDLLDFPAAGGTYPGPTLVIRGERSDYVLPAHREAFARLFPAARHVTVKGAGHWVHAEQPERFQAVLEPFLAAAVA